MICSAAFISCQAPREPFGYVPGGTDAAETGKAAEPSAAAVLPEPVTASLVAYGGSIEHVFFHPLIARPELAFDGDADAEFMWNWFVTVDECEAVLSSLYERDFVLVSAYDTVALSLENGITIARPRAPLVPPGKKPLVLSIDDLNYYPETKRNGTASRLILDDDGVLVSSTRLADGSSSIARSEELITVLELFIAEHPDFSVNGARGIIALTGYYGLFGFRTHRPDEAGYAAQVAGATAVANELKRLGWLFACHSWSHKAPSAQTDEEYLANETTWIAAATPILGPVDIFILPFGALPFKHPAKIEALKRLGYPIVYGVDVNCAATIRDGLYLGMRIPIDGKGLMARAPFLERFVDFDAARDAGRPAHW